MFKKLFDRKVDSDLKEIKEVVEKSSDDLKKLEELINQMKEKL